jgi:regulator of sirC expression with transglutaminase-like and TPR domain
LFLFWIGVAALLIQCRAVRAEEPAAVSAAAATERPAPAEKSAATPEAYSVEQLTERARKSVAVIISDSRDRAGNGLGSGFVISSDGLIVTNYHVIGDGRAVRVQLVDGRQFEVSAIHASDRALDLAVLRIDAKDLTPLELGDSDGLKQGQSVVALGSPLGLRFSVVAGVVSGVREVEGRPMIQMAIPIEPGNSGGPLLDMQGRVQGVMTMKSLVAQNLGFALTANLIKPLLAKPNPIPMARWLTIGKLDQRQWTTLFGARWRQRAGRVTVEGAGQSFGGRSLCLSTADVPERPYELGVSVHLKDETGAAGLAFCSDGGERHYGFYPTGGRMRLTRFGGADVTSWEILHDQPSPHYVAGGWNTLRVRLEGNKVLCFLNDEKIVEHIDSALSGGKAGLVKFRQTQAEFKNFKVGPEVPRLRLPAEDVARVVKAVGDAPPGTDATLVEVLGADPARSASILRMEAARLDKVSQRLRALARAAHERSVTDQLLTVLAGDDEKIDLPRAALLVARFDNDEVDVEAYRAELDQLGRELSGKLAADASPADKLEALRKFMFEENGFHGSRGDYYHKANSYLNEVLDDREGLPITLSIIYLELARQIGLNVVGVGLPGHFVVRYLPAESEPQLIDVFDGARTMSQEEATRRVKEASDQDLTEELLKPLSKRAMITRMLGNLRGLTNNDFPARLRYLNVMLAIDPSSGIDRLQRAVVRYQLDEHTAALEDVEWLLEHRPAGVDANMVLQLQAAIDQKNTPRRSP